MIVSTKGRYALRVMLCFAQRGGDEYIPLKEIAEAEGISQKYLESIMTILSKADFLDAAKSGMIKINGGSNWIHFAMAPQPSQALHNHMRF